MDCNKSRGHDVQTHGPISWLQTNKHLSYVVAGLVPHTYCMHHKNIGSHAIWPAVIGSHPIWPVYCVAPSHANDCAYGRQHDVDAWAGAVQGSSCSAACPHALVKKRRRIKTPSTSSLTRLYCSCVMQPFNCNAIAVQLEPVIQLPAC